MTQTGVNDIPANLHRNLITVNWVSSSLANAELLNTWNIRIIRGNTMNKPGLTSDTGAWLVVVRELNYAHFSPALCILYFTRYCLDKVIIYCWGFVMWLFNNFALWGKNAEMRPHVLRRNRTMNGWVGQFDWLNANMESTNLCGALFKSVHIS